MVVYVLPTLLNVLHLDSLLNLDLVVVENTIRILIVALSHF